MNIPIYLQRRQYQLRNYVLESLYPENERSLVIKRLSKEKRKEYINKMNEIVNECTFVCYIFSMKQFFTEGSRAAKNTVDTLREFNILEFSIGKKTFKERNEAVIEGDILYNNLLASIGDQKLKEFIDRVNYFSEIISEYKKNVSV